MPGIRGFAVLLGVASSILAFGVGAHAGPSENVIFHANLDEYAVYNDIWGYTAPDGREYALLGVNTGVSVVNVTDPASPYETGFIPLPTSDWRDMKTYSHYCYTVNENSGGLGIIDLNDPENPGLVGTYNGFSSAHNLYIDVPSARAFIAGSNVSTGGVRILSLQIPTSPGLVGSWDLEYFHDVYVQGNYLYGSAIYEPRLTILDISNVQAITVAGTAEGYPNAFTHNAWATADQSHVMTTDETSASSVRMWDISNLPTVTQTDAYKPNAGTIPHNTHIDGDFAYISFYTLGVKIVDISDPFDLVEVGSWDTYAPNDGSGFNGCWGVFPFFETTPSLLVASDISTGLYVLEYKGPLGELSGEVTKAGAPGVKISGATLEVMQSGVQATSAPDGTYQLSDAAGLVDVEVSAFAYTTKIVPVTIVEGVTTVLNVTLDPVPGGSIGGVISDGATSLPLPGAAVEIVGTPLLETSDGSGDYEHASVPAGSYTVRVSRFGFDTAEIGLAVGAGQALSLNLTLDRAAAADDFEAADAGWTVSGNASTGQWERGDPGATFSSITIVQPEDDHTPAPGTVAWVTDPDPGNFLGEFDIDGGATILTSPTFDLSGVSNPRVSYWRWYSTGIGNPSTDFWVVEVSNDGGGSWSTVEAFDTAANEWERVDLEIASLVPPTSQVAFRFTAQDTGAGSITEAAIDDFMIYQVVPGVATSAPPVAAGARGIALGNSFPNPARAGEVTSFRLTMPQRGPVQASVYDVTGRRVADLGRSVLEAGAHTLRWSGDTASGSQAPAGVYFVKVRSPFGDRTRKLLLLR